MGDVGVGRRDWSNAGYALTQTTVSDDAELARRLGSVVNYDRSGKLMFLDEFNYFDSLWISSNSGLLFGPMIISDYSMGNGKSLHSHVDTGDSNYVQIIRYIPVCAGSIMSLETLLRVSAIPSVIEITLGIDNDGDNYEFVLQFTSSCQILKIKDSSGVYQTIHNFGGVIFSTSWQHYFRITVDMINKVYLTIQFDENTYDVSAYDGENTSASSITYIYAAIKIYGHAGVNLHSYIDHVLLTEDI